MTVHEALYFLDAYHGAALKQRGLFRPGTSKALMERAAWPTREQLRLNLRLNKSLYPNDQNLHASFMRIFWLAKPRGWMVEEPCCEDCLTPHVQLTKAGLEELAAMNANGCCVGCGHALRGQELKLKAVA